jgi:hypothetical protein
VRKDHIWPCGTPLALICFALFSLLVAQTGQPAPPTVTFTCDFPSSDPSHYVISVSSDGRASYVSDGKLTDQSEPGSDAPARLVFTVSQATSARIFDLAKRARYFEREIDSKKKNLASTGNKTLSYKDAEKNTQANYNYSPVPAVQELTQLFQNLSATLEFGRRIEYDHRYQKLALDQETKRMEEMAKQGSLEDLSAVAPTLQKIVDDPSIINVVRARAQRILAGTGAGK